MSKNSIKIETLSYLVTVLFSIFSVGVILIVVAMLYPYKTIEFHNSPFPVTNNPVKRGEPICLDVSYTRYTDLPCMVVARFTNGITYSYPAQIFHKKPGSYKGISTSFIVPPTLPPGKYIMEICFSYEPNPIRTIIKYAKTQEITVE